MNQTINTIWKENNDFKFVQCIIFLSVEEACVTCSSFAIYLIPLLSRRNKCEIYEISFLLLLSLIDEGCNKHFFLLFCLLQKFRRRVQESTQVLRELEISLRTNHIGWVHLCACVFIKYCSRWSCDHCSE